MTSKLFRNGRSQAVRIPKELRISGSDVSIRRLGDGVFIAPVKANQWPKGYFEKIRIDDEDFVRPEQGTVPSIVDFGS